MEALPSFLQFKDFIISRSEYKFTTTKDAESLTPENILRFQSQYLIDIDFGFRNQKEGIYLFTKVAVNMDTTRQLPGYCLFAEAISVIPSEILQGKDSKVISDQVRVPAINIAINMLRGYLANITAYGPYGKYLLPSIDLQALLNAKTEKQQRAVKPLKSKDK